MFFPASVVETGCLTHLTQLFNFVLALKQRMSCQKFAKDASQAPHVDRRIVIWCPEEEFWRSIPECDYELGQVLGRWVAYETRHAEVCEFDLAAVVHEDVAGLQISV